MPIRAVLSFIIAAVVAASQAVSDCQSEETCPLAPGASGLHSLQSRHQSRQTLRLADGRHAELHRASRAGPERGAQNETCNEGRLAVCVIGQLSRLETESKRTNLLQALGETYCAVDLFAVLEKNSDEVVYVNPSSASNASICNTAWFGGDDLEKEFGKHYTAALFLTHTPYDAHLEHWGKYATEKPWLDRHARIGSHINQLSHIAACSQLVKEHEQSTGSTYQAVLRMRDNTIAVTPVKLPSSDEVLVKKCASWGGYNDKVMLVPRKHMVDAFEAPLKLAKSVEKGEEWATKLLKGARNIESLLKVALSDREVPVSQNNWPLSSLVDGRCAGATPDGFREWCLTPEWKDCRPKDFNIKETGMKTCNIVRKSIRYYIYAGKNKAAGLSQRKKGRTKETFPLNDS